MPTQRKTWREKLADDKDLPKVIELDAVLAKKHGTEATCPITTGIFSWIAANAAMEDEAADKKRITPWWRILKSDGKLNPKFPGGVAEHPRRLAAEGVTVPAKARLSRKPEACQPLAGGRGAERRHPRSAVQGNPHRNAMPSLT